MRLLNTVIGMTFCLFTWGASALASDAPFNPQKIKSIYYLLASARGVGRSSFGHAYLRLSEHETPGLDDQVIEFVAEGKLKSASDYVHALGIGKSVNRIISSNRYSAVLQEMNYHSLRDLTSYELLLSDAQRFKLVTQINQLLQRGKYGEYAFFSNNCAAAVSDLLKEANIPISTGLSGAIPSSIPRALQQSGLSGKVYVDRNVMDRRKLLYQKYESSLRKVIPSIDTLRDALISPEMAHRFFGFTQLLNLAGSPLPPAVQNYLYSFSFFEPRVVRADLQSSIQGHKNLESALMNRSQFEIDSTTDSSAALNLQVTHQTIIKKGSELVLVYDLEASVSDPYQNASERSPGQLEIKLRDLHIDPSGKLFWKDQEVGFSANQEIYGSEFVLTDIKFIPIISPQLNERYWSWDIDTYTLVSHTPIDPGRLDSQTSPRLLPIRNNDPLRPSCYGMVDFQKALLEHVVFDPISPRLSEEQNLVLIRDALDDKVVVIPGFSDARHWILALDENRVRDTVFKYHQAQYANVTGAVSNWRSSHELTDLDLIQIGQVARAGVFTPVFQRVRGNEGHSILILDVIDEGAKLRIVAYDPNLGYVRDLFHFNKKTQKLESTIYPTEALHARSFDIHQDLANIELLGPNTRDLFIELARRSGVFSASPTDLVNAY